VEIPVAGLDVVHAYAVDVGDGVVLVDLGWGSRASLASLSARLGEIGLSLDDVRGVLFTHAHRDHYGLAAAVKKRSGAWLALHPADRVHIGRGRSPSAFMAAVSTETGLDLGKPGERAQSEPEIPLAQPDRPLLDGDVLELGSWRFTVVHTPGHSPGHTCFVVEPAGVVLLGDHVLARTTPNVSLWPWTDGDPLGDFLDSLRRIGRVGVGSLGLPGHEERIVDIPSRANELVAYHEAQLAAVADLVAAGHATIGAVAERMQWSRPWSSLGQLDRVMALGEAHAHLRTLEMRGELTRAGGPPRRFAAV
jgi:glyoxylase-like metal-dependent hydrolase (beta-lactamase superfamily II)